jgi:hypothetical protein
MAGRRHNPFVTFLLFLAVCGGGYAAYHFIVVEKVFEGGEAPAPPTEVMARVRTLVEESVAREDEVNAVTGFGWRPRSSCYRVELEVRDGTGTEVLQHLGKRVSEVVERATRGQAHAEVAMNALGRQVYTYVP